MNQIIKFENIDFKQLVNGNNNTLSINFQSKMIDTLNKNFTDEEQKWYIANLYIYMHYHPTNDYPINLENVFKMIGFANKSNAKRTLENNFTKDEDYKIIFLPRDEKQNNRVFLRTEENLKSASPIEEVASSKSKYKNLGGRPDEQIMLNVDTFKNLCMLVKTDKGREIRRYYVKLENVYNNLVNEDRIEYENKTNELRNQLHYKENENKLLELSLQEKEDKINLLTRKTNKFELGESVYIFHSTIDNTDIYKLGRTKNCNERDSIHKTASYKGILVQVKCINSVLLEKVVHFLLDKYKMTKRLEWFNCSFNTMKNTIYYAKLQSDILIENNDIETMVNFTEPEFKPNDIDNFDLFLSECCEEDDNAKVSYMTVKNQYKIWSKTASKAQLAKLIEFLKTKYKTTLLRHNPLVNTSKKTNHFRCLKIKSELYIFKDVNDKTKLIENFLHKQCQRSPNFRVRMDDFFQEYTKYYEDETKLQFTYIVKEKMKSYLDTIFIRLKTGDESDEKDNRITGWLGISLKTQSNPEPILKYKPKNAKKILQVNVANSEVIKEWSSVTDLADYIKKSRTVTSTIIKRHEQIQIDNIQCILNYK